MALKPEKFPDWATEEEVDPVSGQVNRVEPPDFRKVSGWTRREIPPRQWLNWNLWTISRWVRWAEGRIEAIEDPEQTEFLRKSENLSDLQNAAAGRDNLGVPYSSEAEALAGTAEDRVIAPARFGDNSLTTNGYQVMPGGLIFQWFEHDPGALTNNDTFTVAFPVQFPTACLQVILGSTEGNNQDSTTSSEGMMVTSFTTTQATVSSAWFAFPSNQGNSVLRFFCIGH